MQLWTGILLAVCFSKSHSTNVQGVASPPVAQKSPAPSPQAQPVPAKAPQQQVNAAAQAAPPQPAPQQPAPVKQAATSQVQPPIPGPKQGAQVNAHANAPGRAVAQAKVPHPVQIVQIPGLVQPASGSAIPFRIVEIQPGVRVAVASPPGSNPSQGHSRLHAFFDLALIIFCIGAVLALLYTHRSRTSASSARGKRLSSGFELLPAGVYGSVKHEAAVL